MKSYPYPQLLIIIATHYSCTFWRIMEWNCFSVVVLLFCAFVLSQNHNMHRVSLSWWTFSLWNLQGTSSYWVRKSVRKKLGAPGRSVAFPLNQVSVNELHPIPQIQDFWPTEGAWYINRTTLKSRGGAIGAEEVYALVKRITCWSSQTVLCGEGGGPFSLTPDLIKWTLGNFCWRVIPKPKGDPCLPMCL